MPLEGHNFLVIMPSKRYYIHNIILMDKCMSTYRMNANVIVNSFERPFVTAILGPRRVGKTTLVQDYAEQHPERQWVFLNMDRMDERERVGRQELETLINEHAKRRIGEGEKIWVLIDEAQKCPEVFDQIKILYDAYKDKNKVKFIITGSAILSLHQLSAESLAGRIEINHLYAFNLREATALAKPSIGMQSVLDLLINDINPDAVRESIEAISPFKPELEKQLKKQLVWGGLPELLVMDDLHEKILYLNNYIQTYLEKDVRDIDSISNLNLYRSMMVIIAEQTGSLRDDKRIRDALACTHDTLRKYRGYLQATMMYDDILPYIGNTLRRMVKSPKYYLLNNGIVSVLTGISDPKILDKTGLIGHRLENWFLGELHTCLARDPLPSQVNFWRTTSGAEIDFIVTKNPYVIPFEVTHNKHLDTKKIKNLIVFLAEEKKATWGVYIYGGEAKVDTQKKIIFIPHWAVG